MSPAGRRRSPHFPPLQASLTALGRRGIFAARGYREPAAEAPRFCQSLRIVMALVFAVLPLLLAWSSSTLAKLVLALGARSRGFALRVAPGLG